MGATLFPQQINVAASFDRAHAETMGRVMAKVRWLESCGGNRGMGEGRMPMGGSPILLPLQRTIRTRRQRGSSGFLDRCWICTRNRSGQLGRLGGGEGSEGVLEGLVSAGS